MKKKILLSIICIAVIVLSSTIVVLALQSDDAEANEQLSAIQNLDAQIAEKKALMAKEDLSIEERKAAKEEARMLMEQREDAVSEYNVMIGETGAADEWKSPYTDEEIAAIDAELDAARETLKTSIEEATACRMLCTENPDNAEYAAEYEALKLRTIELQKAYADLLEKYGRN